MSPSQFLLADSNVELKTPNPKINMTRVIFGVLCLAIPGKNASSALQFLRICCIAR